MKWRVILNGPIEMPNFEEEVKWPDDGEDMTGTRLFHVSDDTSKLLVDVITTTMANATRKHWREWFRDPKWPPTRFQRWTRWQKVKSCRE